MQFDKAHLSQSNGIGACFFGQQGMPSGICMPSPAAAGTIVAGEADEVAINGATGPIATPIAIPNTKSQRMTARSSISRKSHNWRELRSQNL
jgi:hypothetical protein